MGIVEIIYISVVFVGGLFLATGGYILQRDRYWRRVWRELGEPQVESVSELRELVNHLPAKAGGLYKNLIRSSKPD